MKSIVALITCHNRKETTLKCLDSLFSNTLLNNIKIHVILVDDGSTDGTEAAVHQRYPQIEILKGDGNLYWNRGMHWAFTRALEIGFDSYLWLNDDTILQPHALDLLFTAMSMASSNEAIVVGAVCDPLSSHTTYGGKRYVSPRFRPFLATMVHPGPYPKDVDVINGNVVLIPSVIAKKLGNLDPIFEHGMGDTDYSMRARKLGIRILLTAAYVGVCSRNPIEGTHFDKSLPIHQRIKHIFSRKGLPWRSWLTMCIRHGGWLWPIHFVWGYMKVFKNRT